MTSGSLKRAFLAVVPPAPVLDAIESLLDRPKSSRFAWTRRDQWHVTLQFYGRIAQVDVLREGLRAAASAGEPMQLAIHGGGAFPNPAKARVFWLGVSDGAALIDLHRTVTAATRQFIDRRDRIELIPHLTVARLKRTTDMTPEVDALAGVPVGGPWTVEDIVLFESESQPGGAVYVEQDRFPLGS